MAVDFEQECFFIAPIGDEGTDIRNRSDEVRDWVVKPAAEDAANLRTVRADDVGEPGQITAQAVQHCLKAKAAVADLTGGNPNVYYELSVRHGAQLPVVLIAEQGTKLPFDISQSRVIFFDHTNLKSAGKAKEELHAQIKASLNSPPDNPIADGMRLAQLQAGDAEEQILAVVMDRLQRLAQATEQIDERLRRAEHREADRAEHREANRWFLSRKPVGEVRRVTPDELKKALTEDEVESFRAEEGMLSPREEAELRAEAEADVSLGPDDPELHS